ncbi:hypothetical protein OUY26_12330 (plasmid) [Levilactobacillus brevis]|uniref:sugar phosphate isomerase/epimerase family protein n=1 Tax=Levilactobacillus brevis TaxID=1580 RepID=UPI002279C19C|nr:hypothetical protein [Levilactobacillus brevis]WAE46286.1 hypothetical protein OUY26_12330 [Levilactobacillus brevis]
MEPITRGGLELANEFILNTIAFKNDLDDGVSQANFVNIVAKLGFDAIEIRNEFLFGNNEELDKISQNANAAGLDVYYSVNDVLIKQGRVNDQLTKYKDEMKRLSAKHLKLNIGDISSMNFALINQQLKSFLNGKFDLVLENNQTIADSNLTNTEAFFKELDNSLYHQIYYCFDIANWKWLHENIDSATKILSGYTKYLHLKNVVGNSDHYTVTSLDEGSLDWRSLINQFRNVDQYGIEYTGQTKTIKSDLEAIKKTLTASK